MFYEFLLINVKTWCHLCSILFVTILTKENVSEGRKRFTKQNHRNKVHNFQYRHNYKLLNTQKNSTLTKQFVKMRVVALSVMWSPPSGPKKTEQHCSSCFHHARKIQSLPRKSSQRPKTQKKVSMVQPHWRQNEGAGIESVNIVSHLRRVLENFHAVAVAHCNVHQFSSAEFNGHIHCL